MEVVVEVGGRGERQCSRQRGEVAVVEEVGSRSRWEEEEGGGCGGCGNTLCG